MQLTAFSSLLLFGTAFAATIAPTQINHAAIFAANDTSPAPLEDDFMSIQATGNFILENKCNYDVHVIEAWDRHASAMRTIKKKSSWKKKFITSYSGCKNNCGVVYKVAKSKNFVGGQGGNQVQFEYSTRDGILYYDISFVDCAKNLSYRKGNAANCPGWEKGIKISGSGCRTMECKAKKMCIANGAGAYYIDQPTPKWGLKDPIGTCPKANRDVKFTLCSSN